MLKGALVTETRSPCFLRYWHEWRHLGVDELKECGLATEEAKTLHHVICGNAERPDVLRKFQVALVCCAALRPDCPAKFEQLHESLRMERLCQSRSKKFAKVGYD